MEERMKEGRKESGEDGENMMISCQTILNPSIKLQECFVS
jgi:hypothetical protein